MPKALWEPGVHPGPDRVYQLLQKRLLLLRHPPGKPRRPALPALGGGHPPVLPPRLGAGLSHLCAPGGRGPLLHRRAAVPPGAGHQRALARLRRDPLGGGTPPGELPAFKGGRGGPVPAAPRDRHSGPLRKTPPAGTDPSQPDGVPAKSKRSGLPGGGGVHGGLPLPDPGGP